MNTLLDNIVYISTQMVVLQTLRAGYNLEMECDNEQQIKNFRSNAVLSTIRVILDDLTPCLVYLADCEKGDIPTAPEHLPHIRQLMIDMTIIFDWAIQEVKLKDQRIKLMNLEQQWK
jgi:hypothetical protein